MVFNGPSHAVLVDFWYGGLNYQIEHHLFPTMPRNKMPVGTAAKPEKRSKPTKADYEASLAAIGSWRDLDADALIAHVYHAREAGSRPATYLMLIGLSWYLQAAMKQ